VVEIEARADDLTDLSERLKLFYFVSQLGAAGLERLDEVDVVDGDCGLRREGAEQGHGSFVEGLDRIAIHREQSHHRVVQHHRRGHGRAETGDALDVSASVARIGEHIGDLLRASVESYPADQTGAVLSDRVPLDVLDEFIGKAERAREAINVAIEQVQRCGVRAAEASRALEDRAKDHVGV
jgi:hypothetical protein